MQHVIEEVDTRQAPDETLRAMHRLYTVLDAEVLPQDPPTPLEQQILDWRNLQQNEVIPRWLLWEGDEVAATSGLYLELDRNRENAWGWVHVCPDHRGRGLARAVARPMLDRVESDGRIRLGVEIPDSASSHDLAARAGMRSVYRERRSRLDFSTVDWELMQRWVGEAEERAGDYELVFLPSPMPDDYVEAYSRVYEVMNTAPREEMVEDDEVMTPAKWRDIEEQHERKRVRLYTYLAVHTPTGEPAGFTTLARQTLIPDLAWQADTGVDPAHRNRGLGRWLKASMALYLREAHPELRRIDTYNAGSNAPMLSINVTMGFRPLVDYVVWQGDLATIRDRLGI